MKRVDISEASVRLADLVDEVQGGRDVIITRDGAPLVKLVSASPSKEREAKLTPEQVARRRRAFEELREIGKRLNINATHEQIKAWIEEGRH